MFAVGEVCFDVEFYTFTYFMYKSLSVHGILNSGDSLSAKTLEYA